MRIKLSPLTFAALLPISAVAEEQFCFQPLDEFVPETIEQEQIQVKAQRAEIQQDTIALFDGNVDIQSNTAQIKADKASIDKNKQQLNATGNVSYRDQQILVKSEEVLLNTETSQLEMTDTNYQLTLFNGRGAAEKIMLDKSKGIELEEVSFTTCPIGQEDWKIVASSISLEEGKVWGEARNTRFYVKGVPVFYLPYFAFPVAAERQTGLLFPQLDSSSSTGVTYEQGVYWNIAPNYDATFTPRIMANRGTQFKTEFRYLTERHQGQVNLEYLANDRGFGTDQDRYFYRYAHTGSLNKNWQISADINGLSDDNYLVDLGSDYYNRADTHLYQTLGLNYYSENLDFSVDVKDFEVIGDHPSTYRALPEMKLFYKTNKFSGL
jgi:LPS-assembly protein